MRKKFKALMLKKKKKKLYAYLGQLARFFRYSNIQVMIIKLKYLRE